MYVSYIDLKELHKYYSALVRSLPNDVSRSIQRLLHVLSDEEIASILNNKNPITCNQALIDCLITRVENKASILDFCEHLWSIKNSPPELHKILERLRKGLKYIYYGYIFMYVYPNKCIISIIIIL